MSHVIGTVALFLSMLLIATSFNAIGVFLAEEAAETDLDEVSQTVGNQITQLIALANLTSGGYLVKQFRLPPVVGRFGYNIAISGGGTAGPITSTTITSPTPPTAVAANARWVNPTFAFVSDNSYAEASGGREVDYASFGFNVPPSASINYVRVTAEHWDSSSVLSIQMSGDRGTSFFATTYQFPQLVTEGLGTLDVTDATLWTSGLVNAIAVKAISTVTGGGTRFIRLDHITIQVSYTATVSGSTAPYILMIRSDNRGVVDANFTLPWNASARVIHDPNALIPGVTNRGNLLSGFRAPVIWAYSNSTHIIFGLGTKA